MDPLVLPSVREEGEGKGERGGSRGGDDDDTAAAEGGTGLPTSPSWRRSPSYEQLQKIELDAHPLAKSSRARTTGGSLLASPPHSSDKRTLTLSVSGSEAESIYGKPACGRITWWWGWGTTCTAHVLCDEYSV